VAHIWPTNLPQWVTTQDNRNANVGEGKPSFCRLQLSWVDVRYRFRFPLDYHERFAFVRVFEAFKVHWGPFGVPSNHEPSPTIRSSRFPKAPAAFPVASVMTCE
jgi:hypothetical protein